MSAIIKYIRYIPISEHNASLKKLGEKLFTTGSSLIASTSCFFWSDDLETFSAASSP